MISCNNPKFLILTHNSLKTYKKQNQTPLIPLLTFQRTETKCSTSTSLSIISMPELHLRSNPNHAHHLSFTTMNRRASLSSLSSPPQSPSLPQASPSLSPCSLALVSSPPPTNTALEFVQPSSCLVQPVATPCRQELESGYRIRLAPRIGVSSTQIATFSRSSKVWFRFVKLWLVGYVGWRDDEGIERYRFGVCDGSGCGISRWGFWLVA
ncbi:hypothetical protein Drorol1_Dr00016946 [Drosera rotundifolia]